ncbi:MAG: hypothetical protein P0S93_05955 [Candidatus Neptunochlamydia sp.]|nr:hypothetical protein [Candidatus Neptunochlamydia sp.]
MGKEPRIVKGVLPPPGENFPATTGKVAAIARSSGIIAEATIGSAITKVSPLPKDPKKSVRRLKLEGNNSSRS